MSRRRTISVHDYPEHLNPFSEEHQPEDEPATFKFHTMGRPKRRQGHASAWNLFASRKSKPVEASLNLSPRLPRSTSLTNNELHEPPPPTRRKLFPDLTWLPGRRRFGSVSQTSSPSPARRQSPLFPEESSMQRYRSISLTRTSEMTSDPPLLSPRTHRYRSPSPVEDNRYRPSSVSPPVNGGQYYSTEQRYRSASVSPPGHCSERLYIDEPQQRHRTSSMSPTANGGHYTEKLYIEETWPANGGQGVHTLPRYRASAKPTPNGRLYIDESQLANGGSQYMERLYIEEPPPSVSPSSNRGKQSPATSPNGERASPFEEPLVAQRPPRPPRTKKRRAPPPPLPPLPQSVLPPRAPSPAELRTTSAEQGTNVSEQHYIVVEQRTSISEQQSNFADQQTIISEQQSNVAEQQTSISEQQTSVAEEQTSDFEQRSRITEQQSNVAEQQMNISEEQSDVAERELGDRQKVEEPDQDAHDLARTEIDTALSESSRESSPEQQADANELDQDSSTSQEQVRKPQTKLRTKFGVSAMP